MTKLGAVRKLTAVAVAIEAVLLALFTLAFALLAMVFAFGGGLRNESAQDGTDPLDWLLLAAAFVGLVALIGCAVAAAIYLWLGARGVLATISIIIVALANTALIALALATGSESGADWVALAVIVAVTAGCILSVRALQAEPANR